MCLPTQMALWIAGVERSSHLVTEISWTATLPAPAPPPVWALPELDIPQLQARMSISPLCLWSLDSPLMSPSFRNISEDTANSFRSAFDSYWVLGTCD